MRHVAKVLILMMVLLCGYGKTNTAHVSDD